MRTALYTIFRCTNYGAVLQAYALARVLRGMVGEDSVDVLNHRMDPRDNHLLGKITNPNTPWFQRWRNRRKFEMKYVRPDLFELRRRKTIHLISEQIRPADWLYRSPLELRDLPPCSTVVVGSDQVWNPRLNHDFGHNQYLGMDLPEGQDRVAYAASFGMAKLPQDCAAEYRTALARFRKITVREETGAEIVQTLLGVRPEVVLDPSMLLSAAEWQSVVGDRPVASPCVAAYWVRTVSQPDIEALAQVAARCGRHVRLMSAGPLPKLKFPAEVIPYIEADPFDFVREIAAAEAVVTDSFHGLQFATLFRKLVAVLGDLHDPASNAARLVDFCARYGLSGGLNDLTASRAGAQPAFADFTGFAAEALAADRARSLETLREMLP